MLAAVTRIAAAVDVPVTADLEDALGLGPDELAEGLRVAGVVGCNLEDSDHRGGGLRDVGEQAAYLAAVRAAAPDLVLNARVDVHLRGGSLDDGLARARAYREAGADCVYPISCLDEPGIAAYVEAAGVVNVHLGPTAPPLARLAALGVARASFGTSLFRVALEAAAQAAAAP
jgi:2-methylisocitrate lyase-like PEP mutase family enzyme